MSTPAEEVWHKLSDVERTALQTALYRADGEHAFVLPDGETTFDGSLDRLMVSAMPLAVQQEHRRQPNHAHLVWMVGLRTAVIDSQATMLASTQHIRQVVILGAGLDSRAWRLQWPEGTTIFEVDTGSLEAVKSARLAAAAPKSPSCRRKFLRGDLAQADEVQQGLRAGGLDAGQAVLWVLEGLVGYLGAPECLALFRMMRATCAPGSRTVITAPPTPRLKADVEQLGQRLHHATFEAVDATVARLEVAGWSATLLDFAASGPQAGVTWKQLAGDEEPPGLIIGVTPPL